MVVRAVCHILITAQRRSVLSSEGTYYARFGGDQRIKAC